MSESVDLSVDMYVRVFVGVGEKDICGRFVVIYLFSILLGSLLWDPTLKRVILARWTTFKNIHNMFNM